MFMIMLSAVPSANGSQAADDLRLAHAAGRGELRAQQELASRLYTRVRTTVHYIAAGDPDADDFVQTAMIQLLNAAGTFRGDGSLDGWADRVTVRLALRQLKRRRQRPEISLPDDRLEYEGEREGAELGPRERGSVEQQLQRRQLHGHLTGLLGELAPEKRAAVILHWVHGYSAVEIAELTDTKVTTVRWRLQRGKKELRRLIGDDPVLKHWRGLLP